MAQPTPMTLLNKASGKSLTTIAKQGIGGWLFALSTSAILGVQAITRLLLFPVRKIVEIGDATVDALVLKPLTIVITGSEATAQSVANFEFLGLPFGTVILLGTFAIVGMYLRRQGTSDFLPGTFTDFGGPFIGVDEQTDAETDEG